MEKCVMQLMEFPDLSDGWVCSACDAQFKATARFERNTHCPDCGREIIEWEDEEHGEH